MREAKLGFLIVAIHGRPEKRIFVGSVREGIRNACLMRMVSSAYRHDLDVEAYLEDVLTQVLSGSTDYDSMISVR